MNASKMRINASMVLAVLLAAALAGGCARSETPLLKDFSVTEKDSGRGWEFYKGSLFEVRLAGNPTTGYSWGLMPETDNDLVLKADPERYEPEAPGRTGAGGTQVFRFQGAVPGVARLVFGYRRPWEAGPPIKSAVFQIKVNDVH